MTDVEDEASGETGDAPTKRARRRTQRNFPAGPFEDSVKFTSQVFEFGSGTPVRRLSLFDHLGKSPDSSASRQMITNAGKYGLIRGSYAAEHLELTPDGSDAVDDAVDARTRAKAFIKLAVENIEPFRLVYEQFQGNRLPAKAALVDAIKSHGVNEQDAEEAVDTLVVNLRFVGLLKTLSGADRLVSVEHVMEHLPAASESTATTRNDATNSGRSLVTKEQADFDTMCFYVTPIGSDGSDARRHSDLFLGSIVEPALQTMGFKVVRADGIGKPGMITRQVIEYLLKARLVIADLSFHNPNVFYELALRHSVRLPIVQIIRSRDSIPFDIQQMRTVVIDDTDVYSLVPKIETYRSEIASHARRAIEEGAEVDNPLATYFPGFRVEL